MKIVIFGAGGRAGRRAVTEARRRGHEITAVVRDPARHSTLTDVRVVRGDVVDAADVAPHDPDVGQGAVAGDVVDAADVAQASAGHDAAISAAVDLSVAPQDFFTTSSRALSTGLTKAGVRRLVVVGLASIMPGVSGALMMDEPGYPNEYRDFYLGHAAGLDELRGSDLDWTYVAPAGDFDHDGSRTGRYRIAEHGDPDSRISYADFAIALLDEIETPRHPRATVIVRDA